MKLKQLFIPLTGLALISLTNPSYAGTSWSSVAAGCVPEAAGANRVDSNPVFGTVSFRGSSTGRIRLTCPITGLRTDDFLTQMRVNYYDPDGRGTTCQVRAFLLRTNLNELERGNTIVGFDSDTGSSVTEPGTGRSLGSVDLTETIDFDSNYYWIDLELSGPVKISGFCFTLACDDGPERRGFRTG